MGYAQYQKFIPPGLQTATDLWGLKFFRDFNTKYQHLRKLLYHGSYCPEPEFVFRAFEVNPKNVKFVIVSQGPCPVPGYSNGLALSVKKSIPWGKLTYASRHVIQEYSRCFNKSNITHGDLSGFMDKGGLLLNLYLTCAPFNPDRHEYIGWEDLAIEVCQTLAHNKQNLVFAFCGYKAWRLEDHIKNINNNHLILKLQQPNRRGVVSPKSVKFLGSGVFRIISEYTGVDLSSAMD